MASFVYLWGDLAQLNDAGVEPPTGGLDAFDSYEFQLGTVLTLIDAEAGFTARQFGLGETFTFGDGVAGAFERIGDLTRFAVTDVADVYPWERAVFLSDVDDTRSWETIKTYVGAEGDRLTQSYMRDDGVAVANTFGDGLTSQLLADVRDTRGWDTIERRLEDGVIVSAATLYDDGTTGWTYYEAGARVDHFREDVTDIYTWSSIYNEYEAGLISAAYRQQDNGDTISTFFEDGARERIVIFDGSNTRPWETRTTTLDADGNILDIVLA